nr:putative integron gene cassette protein [uncultured bacterium]CAP47493.1 putative integron gene cassette protein [uncultured bacterium]CAP47494.1 putative integron gene cassette protein [uncultured bacterium]
MVPPFALANSFNGALISPAILEGWIEFVRCKAIRYWGGDSSLSLSDAGSPATPQCDLGISWTTTSTACLGIPKSTKTLVMP